MERPTSVTVIAALFFLVAAYLVTIGISEFVAPGSVATASDWGHLRKRTQPDRRRPYPSAQDGRWSAGDFIDCKIGRAGARWSSW